MAAERWGKLPGRLGRYRLLKLLGRGGMGAVYLAHDDQLDRRVALKVPFLGTADRQERLERFRREARAAAGLDHPHICPVFDVGEIDGIPFLTMAYVQGQPLADRIDPHQPLPQEWVVDLVRKLALALDRAHRQGVIHRDLKPANIMMKEDGEPVIMDFGLAKRLGRDAALTGLAPPESPACPPAAENARLTEAGAVLGTPAYMAPEQVQGEPDAVGPAADIYSLGVILYELLTGRVPFEGPVPAVIGQVLYGKPDSPARLRPDLAPGLEAVCLRAMAKRSEDRYGSMADFAGALDGVFPPGVVPPVPKEMGAGGEVPGADLRTASPSLAGPTGWIPDLAFTDPGAPAAGRPKRRPGRPWAWAAGGCAGALLLIGLIALSPARRGSGPPPKDKRPSPKDVKKPAAPVPVVPAPEPPAPPVGPVRRLVGHKGGVGGVAFSPDGRRVASVGDDRTARVWDVESGKETARFAKHKGCVKRVRFTGDGRCVLSTGDDAVLCLWDAETGAEEARFEGHTQPVWAIALSPDHRQLLSGSHDGAMRLWDLWGGKLLRPVHLHTASVRSVVFLPDGRRALSVSRDDTACLWDTQTGQELHRFPGKGRRVLTTTLSPDGRRAVSAGEDSSVGVWEIESGQELRQLRGHAGPVSVALFLPGGHRILTGGYDRTVRLWDAATGQELRRFLGHAAIVHSVALSSDGRFGASSDADGTVLLWPLPESSANPRPLAAFWGEVRRFRGHTQAVSGVAFAPDGGQFLSGSADRTARVWDVRTGREVQCFRGHQSWVAPVAFAPDGRRALSGGGDQTMRLWDVATGRQVIAFDGHKDDVVSVAFSPDGQQVLSGTSNAERLVRLWQLPALDKPAKAPGKLAPKELRRFAGHGLGVNRVAFSPDGKRIYSGSWDRTVRTWDRATGKQLGQIQGPAAGVLRVAYSPDVRRALGVCADGSLRLWDLESGAEVRRFQGPTATVHCGAFSPDGRRVVSGGHDGAVRVWDVESGRVLFSFEGHDKLVTCLAVAPHARLAVSGGEDRTLRLWQLPHPEVTNSVGMRLVWVPAGVFIMGASAAETSALPDEMFRHPVRLSRPFWMGVREVTQKQFAAVMGGNPSSFAPSGSRKADVPGLNADDFPVESVSWAEAEEFCRRLSALTAERKAGRVYRLPTEAEWEYACRAGTTTAFHSGPLLASLFANFDGNSPYGGAAKGPVLGRPTRVGSYPPNPFGLCDMHGNVWEWCADHYAGDSYRRSPSTDPRGPDADPRGRRVLRSGSWRSWRGAWTCRSASRFGYEATARSDDVGFRIVCEMESPAVADFPGR